MIKEEIKKIKSFIKIIGITLIINILIVFFMRLLTFYGLSIKIASTISAYTILIIPITALLWLVNDLISSIITIPKVTKLFYITQ